MTLRSLASALTVFAVLAFLPSRALAQNDPKNSVSFAYMHLKVNGDGHNGFAVDFNHDLKSQSNMVLRGIGQFAFLHSKPRNIVTATGGVQVAWTNVQRIVPFGQIAAGVLNASHLGEGSTHFVLTYDFGADIKIHDADQWRARVQFGWASILGSHSETGWRFAAGAQRRF